VRVSSDKQTLILAGEPVPPRAEASRAEAGMQLQRVTMLVVQGEYAANPPLAADLSPARFLPAADSERVLLPSAVAVDAPAELSRLPVANSLKRASFGGAAQYARTQNLSSGGAKTQLIDTYA